MQCPHCHNEISVNPHVFALGEDKDGTWQVASSRCPVCQRLLVNICTVGGCTYPAWPATSSRPRPSDDVPDEYATEYLAAAQVLAYSPEASAALSRRLLQRLLAEHTGASASSLAQLIEKVARSPELPSYLKEALRTLSKVANLGTDVEKSKRPETLTAVEPGEPEWLLDVLQPLFEFYFVQPARLQRRHDELEERLGLLTGAAEEPSPASGTIAPDDPASKASEPTSVSSKS